MTACRSRRHGPPRACARRNRCTLHARHQRSQHACICPPQRHRLVSCCSNDTLALQCSNQHLHSHVGTWYDVIAGPYLLFLDWMGRPLLSSVMGGVIIGDESGMLDDTCSALMLVSSRPPGMEMGVEGVNAAAVGMFMGVLGAGLPLLIEAESVSGCSVMGACGGMAEMGA